MTDWLGCQGCGLKDKRESIRYHEVRDCPNKSAGCAECGEIMPASRLAEHYEAHCPHRMLKCPNARNGCCEELMAKHLDAHARFRCPCRMVDCSLGCGAQLLFRNLMDHQVRLWTTTTTLQRGLRRVLIVPDVWSVAGKELPPA